MNTSSALDTIELILSANNGGSIRMSDKNPLVAKSMCARPLTIGTQTKLGELDNQSDLRDPCATPAGPTPHAFGQNVRSRAIELKAGLCREAVGCCCSMSVCSTAIRRSVLNTASPRESHTWHVCMSLFALLGSRHLMSIRLRRQLCWLCHTLDGYTFHIAIV